MSSLSSWSTRDAIAFGGDYNPEQWPRETWVEDVALMREAGVNLVSVNIWGWAFIEPSEGVFDFSQLDEIINLLHDGGIAVDLATPTASPPAWFFANYPDSRVINRDGVVMGFGSRGMAAPSSPDYRKAAVRVASALAERYADHPAVVMWHVHNEYGAPVGEDYSVHAAVAFRSWLRTRYSTLDGLNAAWGTAFWGQVYRQWEHVNPPAASPGTMNPAQRLDFDRFTDHQLRACYIAERDAIRAYSDKPITTNFMANECPTTDMFAWAREVDVVSNDHYLTAADPRGHVGLALAADLTRSVAGGAPWILMEHSTSAVNWQPRNVAKRPDEMARNSLAHLARGSDAVMFFQWRASRSGSEKFHSSMVPHAGTSSRVWREVVDLGAKLSELGEVTGSTVTAEVALLWDTESHWAQSLDSHPSEGVDHKERIRAYYERLWRDGITTDFAHPEGDLSSYKLVIAPANYLLTLAAAENLRRYVEAGGTLVVSFFSGIVNEHDAVHVGGYLAPLRDVLGLTVEEFLPLREEDELFVSFDGMQLRSDTWADDIALEGAEVVGTYVDGPAAGAAAITRNAFGSGQAWYVSTKLAIDELAPVMARAYADAGVSPAGLPRDVEVVTRHGDTADYSVVLNHTEETAELSFTVDAVDLLTGSPAHTLALAPGGSAVVRVPKAGNAP